MHRQLLLNLLRQHLPADAHEQAMTSATTAFVEQYPTCFERSLLVGTDSSDRDPSGHSRPGHITGSAWIVCPDRHRTVLVHHRKLDRWLQPGGHADGDVDAAAVALREAQEETGLTSLRFVGSPDQPSIFDVDVHSIPARGDVPEHLHYDIRFLMEANPDEPFEVSDEVRAVRWVSVEDVSRYDESESISRLVRKTGTS